MTGNGSSRAGALALLLLLGVLWSLSYVLIKVAVATVPPYTIVAGRILLAALLLAVWMRAVGGALPRVGRGWVLFAALGFFGNVLPFSLISWGQQHIDAGLTAILLGMVPLFTILMVQLVTAEERPTASSLGGIALGIGGLVLLVGPDALSGLGSHTLAQFAVVAAAASYAVTTVLARGVRGGHLSASAMVMILATVMILPASLVVDRPWTLSPSSEALWAILFMGAASTGLATIVFFRLVSREGATFTSFVNYLIPPLGVAWSATFLGERLESAAIAALVLILSGIALVNRRPRAQSARSSTSAMP